MKISALAVAAVLCSAVVRRGTPEIALVISLVAGAAVVWLSMDALEQVIYLMERMANLAQVDSQVLRPVIKTVVISILTRVSGEICKSGGESGLAAFVETAGTLLALGVSLPLVEGVLELMGRLVS